jgi:hypothetical protein
MGRDMIDMGPYPAIAEAMAFMDIGILTSADVPVNAPLLLEGEVALGWHAATASFPCPAMLHSPRFKSLGELEVWVAPRIASAKATAKSGLTMDDLFRLLRG